jgi:hypothetical protein
VAPPTMPIAASTPARAIVERRELRANISLLAVATFPSRVVGPLLFARTVRFAPYRLTA